MTAPTHVTFAEFVYLLILTTTGIPLSFANALLIGISSVLPDIDTAASTVGKIMPFVSTKLERKFGHRTLTHSSIFLACLSIVLLPFYFLNRELYVCVLVGYASHPFLDTMTVNGVKLFYPFSSVKCVFPFEVNNPHRYRMQTGSKGDKMLAVIFLAGCIPSFVVAYEGYERFVRVTQQNIEAAVRDYNEFSKDHFVFAQVVAYSSLTKQSLDGTIKIIGALNPHTVVFKSSDGRPHTLGKEFQADYVVENILCAQGKLTHSSIRNVDLSNQLLSQVTSYVDSLSENYFFGDLSTSDKVSLPENIKIFTPVTGGGSTIKLNYATYDDIRTFNLEYVYITKGILTIKSISADERWTQKEATDASLPKLENYVQISVTLNEKETIECLKEKGDPVHEKDLLAKKNLAQFYEDQIKLNHEKIAALEAQRMALVSEFSQKISNAEQTVRIDSEEYSHNLELLKNHYLSISIIESSQLKLKKESQALSALVFSKSSQLRRTSIDVKKLEIQDAQLEAKARSAEVQSEIRSTANGVLVDIRQVPHNNKTQVTFIIKRTR